MLSLIELQRKKVEAKRKKYDKDEMDSYLELVYENYRELLDQVKKLEAEKAELNQKVKTERRRTILPFDRDHAPKGTDPG